VLGKSAVNAGTKFLKLLPYKTATLRSFCLQTPKQEFVTIGGFEESVSSSLLDPVLMFYSDEAWFTLSGYVNRYWSTENPHAIHEVPFHGLKVGFRV
jgi:hypothetical protein